MCLALIVRSTANYQSIAMQAELVILVALSMFLQPCADTPRG